MPKPDYRSKEAEAYRKLYKTYRWQQTRKRQLQLQPLCQPCKRAGRITIATVCHHLDKASKADPARFFAGPFESQCAPCHDGPTQSEEKTGCKAVTIGTDGWPV